MEDYTFLDTLEDCDIQKLLHCLTDTFEDNKREAAEILIACSKHGPSKMVIVSAKLTVILSFIHLVV